MGGLPPICNQTGGPALVLKGKLQEYNAIVDSFALRHGRTMHGDFNVDRASIILRAEHYLGKGYLQQCGLHKEMYKLLLRILKLDEQAISNGEYSGFTTENYLVRNSATNMKLISSMLHYHMTYGIGSVKDFGKYLDAAVFKVDWSIPFGDHYPSEKAYLEAEMISAYLRLKQGYKMENKTLLFQLLQRLHSLIITWESKFTGAWRTKGTNSMKANIAFQIITLIETGELTQDQLEKYKDMISYYSDGKLPVIITDSMPAREREAAEKTNTEYIVSALQKISRYSSVYQWVKKDLQSKRARTKGQESVVWTKGRIDPVKAADIIKGLIAAINDMEEVGLVKPLTYESLYSDIITNGEIILKRFGEDVERNRLNPKSENKYYNLYFNLVQIYNILESAGIKPEVKSWIKKNIIDRFGNYYDPRGTKLIDISIINKQAPKEVISALRNFNPDGAEAATRREGISPFVSAAGLLQIAEYYLYSRNFEKVEEYIDKIENKIAPEPKKKFEISIKKNVLHYLRLLKARIHMGKAKYDGAEKILLKMTESSNEAKIELANLYYITGRHGLAVEVYLTLPEIQNNIYYSAKKYSLEYLMALHQKKRADQLKAFRALKKKVESLMVNKNAIAEGLAFKYDMELFLHKIDFAIAQLESKFKDIETLKSKLLTHQLYTESGLSTEQKARLAPLIYSAKSLYFDIESSLLLGKPLLDDNLEERIKQAENFLADLKSFQEKYSDKTSLIKINPVEKVYIDTKRIEIASYLAMIYDNKDENLSRVRAKKLGILNKYNIEGIFNDYFTYDPEKGVPAFKPEAKIYEPEEFYLLLSYVFFLQKQSALLSDETIAKKALDIIRRIREDKNYEKYRKYINDRNDQDMKVTEAKLLIAIGLKETSLSAQKEYFDSVFKIFSKIRPEDAAKWEDIINLDGFTELSLDEKFLLQIELAEIGRIYVQTVRDKGIKKKLAGLFIAGFEELGKKLDGDFKHLKRKSIEDKIKINIALLKLGKVYLASEETADRASTIQEALKVLTEDFKLDLNDGKLKGQFEKVTGWNKINLYFAVADVCKMLLLLTRDSPNAEKYAKISLKFYESIANEFDGDLKHFEVILAQIGILQIKVFLKETKDVSDMFKKLFTAIIESTPADTTSLADMNIKRRLTLLSKLGEAMVMSDNKVNLKEIIKLYAYLHEHKDKIEDKDLRILNTIRYIDVVLRGENVTNIGDLKTAAKSVLELLFTEEKPGEKYYKYIPTYQLEIIFKFFDQSGLFIDPVYNDNWVEFVGYFLDTRLEKKGEKYETLYLESKIYHAEEAIWSQDLLSAESILKDLESYSIQNDTNNYKLRIAGTRARLARLKKSDSSSIMSAYEKALIIDPIPKNYLYKLELWIEYIEYLVFTGNFIKAEQEIAKLKRQEFLKKEECKRMDSDTLSKSRILARLDLLPLKLYIFKLYKKGEYQVPTQQTWRDASFLLLDEAKQLSMTIRDLESVQDKALEIISDIAEKEGGVFSHRIMESYVYFELGQYYISMGEEKKGIYLINQAIIKNPKDTEILIFLAKYHFYKKGSYSEAKKYMDRVLKIDPKHIGARMLLKRAESLIKL